MTFLVDANILSEPTRPQPSQRVLEWLGRNEDALVVNPIILGEIQFGILLLPKGRKRQQLEQWFAEVVSTITCLPWDTAAAGQWAKLLVKLRQKGQAMPIKDSMIAATALANGFTIATRNEKDFSQAGIPVLNPFQDSR